MYQIDFEKPVRIHFIGIGGISMSGLAEILLSRNFQVSGSDWSRSTLTDHLASRGAKIYIGQSEENITDDIQAVVYTAAIHKDNPEFMKAAEAGIPMMTRAELVGQLMKNYGSAVAVSGTHGKTTTTSMLAEILLQAEADPTISVGGILPTIGGNVRIGYSDCMITEACEYTNSFLDFFPTLAVVLNVRPDHLDFFKDIEDIRHSFRRFMELVPAEGAVVIDTGIDRYEELTEGLACRVITVGPGGDYQVVEICGLGEENTAFTVSERGGDPIEITLQVPGSHNIENSLAAIAAARELGIQWEAIQKGLAHFGGTDRRFQKKGTFQGVTVVDDYAHHPDEIQATLSTAKGLHYEKVWCVFQPHTYSRTKALLDEFAQSLSLADEVVLADIYPARETDTLGMHSRLLVDKINALGGSAHYVGDFEEIKKYLYTHCLHDELLITMGAGDVVKIGEQLVES